MTGKGRFSALLRLRSGTAGLVGMLLQNNGPIYCKCRDQDVLATMIVELVGPEGLSCGGTGRTHLVRG